MVNRQIDQFVRRNFDLTAMPTGMLICFSLEEHKRPFTLPADERIRARKALVKNAPRTIVIWCQITIEQSDEFFRGDALPLVIREFRDSLLECARKGGIKSSK